MKSGKQIRQAVVVIHGMGEQKPLGIARRFVEVAIANSPDSEPRYHSRPDKISPGSSFDLRRFLAPREEGRAQTEFYEYHWAHLMSGNTLADLKPLVRSVMARWPWTVGRLLPVWALL